jgi:hypothetical protein
MARPSWVLITHLAMALSCYAYAQQAADYTKDLFVVRKRIDDARLAGKWLAPEEQTGPVEVFSGSELLARIRSGWRHILVREHIDLQDGEELPGISADVFASPSADLALQVRLLLRCRGSIPWHVNVTGRIRLWGLCGGNASLPCRRFQ